MNERTETLVSQLEIETLAPNTRKLRARLDELIADTFIEFGSLGKVYTKHDILSTLPNEPETERKATDLKATVLSKDIVLVIYTLEKTVLGENNKNVSLRSSLWQNHDGHWRMIFHQGTSESKGQ